jgi:hypothetical protein
VTGQSVWSALLNVPLHAYTRSAAHATLTCVRLSLSIHVVQAKQQRESRSSVIQEQGCDS